MPNLEIRRAVLSEAKLLAELGARTFRATYPVAAPLAMDEYVAKHFVVERIEAQLRAADSRLLIAYLADRAIGYAHLCLSEVPDCVLGIDPVELSRLYLDQDVQGAGHGSALMRAALDEAIQWERHTMWLGVYSENLKARTFYSTWGFKDVGVHDFSIGGKVYTDPVMSRRLR